MIIVLIATIAYVMAAVITQPAMQAAAGSIPGFMHVHDFIHFPARLGAALWYAAGLPPYGDAALLIYHRAVWMQWIFVGLILTTRQFSRRQDMKGPSL